MKKEISKICSFLLTVAAFTACGGDFETQLPGNYSLFRMNPDEVIIARHTEGGSIKFVVGPRVSGYRVFSDIVVGEVVLPDWVVLRKESTPGYFVLDTTTHEVMQGMDKATWQQELRRMGLPDDPALPQPSRWR
jgi:hypothetical protein